MGLTKNVTITAEYYNIPSHVRRANPGKTGKLEIFKIGGSLAHRELLTAFLVEGIRDARRLARAYDATPWNF